MTAARAPALEIRDLSLAGALDPLGFDLAPGATLALVGPPDAGLDALARLIVRAVDPDEGVIRVRSQRGEADLAALRGRPFRQARRRLGVAFADPRAALNPHRPLGWSIAEPLRAAGLDRRATEARVAVVAAALGVETEHLARYPHALTDRTLARAVLARAFAAEPDLVLVEDPLGRLDAAAQGATLDRLARAREQSGAALVFLTTDWGRAARIADRIGVLHAGRLVEIGPAADLIARPFHPLSRALAAGAAVPPVDRADPPRGCRFHPACPHARPLCALETPVWREIAADRRVACRYAEEIVALPRPADAGAAP